MRREQSRQLEVLKREETDKRLKDSQAKRDETLDRQRKEL